MSDEDDKTLEFYNAPSDDESSRLKIRTPIQQKQEDNHETENIKKIKKEVKLADSEHEKSNKLYDTEDISNDILKSIPAPSNPLKPIASQRKEVENQKKEGYELHINSNNDITTVPARRRPNNDILDDHNRSPKENNKIPELTKSEVKTGQATFKSPAEEPIAPPRRSQLSKPNFALKK